MELILITFAGGAVIILWLYLWSRQRQTLGAVPDVEAMLREMTGAGFGDAVLVAREHGQLLHLNDTARRWLNVEIGEPDLELLAHHAQPADSFLELFAREGQASFQLANRWVEAASHRIPVPTGTGTEIRIVVVLRELTGSASTPGGLDLSKAINIVTEIGETVNASLGIEQVMQVLLTIVRKTLPYDAGEICLWDVNRRVLVPRGWVGDAGYVLLLTEAGGVYAVDEGISGWIARYRKPVLVTDVREDTAVRPKFPNSPYKSFVAVPLLLGERFVGTFELASTTGGRFMQSDLALLQAVAQGLATAIFNAELYTEQTRRIDDLASLQSVASETDAEAVYALLNERIAKLMSADVCGVLLYDERKSALVAELPFYGLPPQLVRSYTMPLLPGSTQRDLWEAGEYWISNDLADEPLVEEMRMGLLVNPGGMYNTALMPLQLGARRIGMVQVGNKRSHGGFTTRDMNHLRLLATQAAVVVEDVRLVQHEQQRDAEMLGLQELAQAFGALSHAEKFYASTNERIARLMGLSMCGILLYDLETHSLRAQVPFYGISDDLIAYYQIKLDPGSPIEQIWLEEDYWYTNRVPTDGVVLSAGLADLASALNVTKTMLAVITAGGRRIGAVQVSNKLNGEDFNEKDARLLLIFAAQVGGMIENTRLFYEAQRRADEAQALREIAELASAILSPEDSFAPALAEICRLMNSPGAFIGVLDAENARLFTYPRHAYGVELTEPFIHDTYQKGFEYSVAISRRPFLSNDVLNDNRVLPSYLEIAQKINIQSIVMVPLVVGDVTLGELGVMNRKDLPYGDNDQRLMGSIAIQIAAALDRVRLSEATGQNLRRRLQELDAINRVSNELAQTLDVDRVLEIIRHEAVRATEADGSSVAMLTHPDEWVSADQPEIERRLGDRRPLAGLADIECQAVFEKDEVVIIRDYLAGDLNPMPEEARSAMAVGIPYEDRVVGVIHLYHREPNHFDEREATFLMTLAAKASLSYGNYLRFYENQDRSDRLRRRVEQLNQIFELGQMLQTGVEATTMLEAIAYSMQQSCGYDVVLMSLADTEAGVMRRTSQAGLPITQFEASRGSTMALDKLDELFMRQEFRISESLFLPIEKLSQWYVQGLEALSPHFSGNRTMHPRGRNDWRDGDMLLVPVRGVKGEWLGVMSVDRPFNGQRPDQNVVEILEVFAHQAAATIENTRLYIESVRAGEQETRVNEIMEAISHTLNTEDVVQAGARGLLRLLPFSRMSVVLLDTEHANFLILRVRVASDGKLTITQERRSELDDTALGCTFETGQDFIYTADSAIEQFDDLRSSYAAGERSSLVVPLITGGVCLGAMHLGSESLDTKPFEDYREVVKRVANLLAVAVQNARLFSHAVNLRMFNESVVESIQQGIIALDRTGRILTINQYMRRRFNWDDDAVNENLFEYRPALRPLLESPLQKVLDTRVPQELIEQQVTEGSESLVQTFYLYPLLSADSVRGAVLLVDDLTDRALLERNIEERARQLAVLTEVGSRITASLRRDEVIALALDEMERVIDYDTVILWRRDGAFLMIEGARGITPHLGEDRVPLESDESLMRVLETQRVGRAFKGAGRFPGRTGMESWMAVPLIEQGGVVGLITLGKREPNVYDVQAEQAAQAFANQVAVALVNAELFEEAQSRTQRLSLLNRVSVALAHSLDTENILEIALRESAQVIGFEIGCAYLLEREVNLARAVVDYPRGDAPPTNYIELGENTIFHKVVHSAEPFTVEDVALLSDRDRTYRELAARDVRSYMLLPMTVSGQVNGVIELFDHNRIHTFDPEKLDLALIIANQAAIAVLNSNLLEQTLVRTRELETLLEAAQATSYTLDLDEVFHSVIRLVLQALDMDDCAIMMYDNVAEVLRVELDLNRRGEPSRVMPPGTEFDLFQYPAKLRAMREAQIVIIRAEDDGTQFSVIDPKEIEEMRAHDETARMLVPLIVREQPIGLLQIELRSQYRTFTHREIRMAQALAAQAASAIENARLSTETSAQVEQSLVINELSRSISSTMDISDMIRIVRDQVPPLTDAESMYCALYDNETQTIVFPMAVKMGKDYFLPPRQLGNDEVSYVIRHRRPLSLGGDNPSAGEVRRNLNITNGEDDAVRYLGVPLVAGDQVVGVLAIRDTRKTRPFGLNDQRILTTIGTQLGAAIQNAHLFERVRNFADELNRRVEERTYELQEERDRINALYRITAELGSTLDMDRLLERALENVSGSVNADDGVVLLVNPLNDRLYLRASRQPVDGERNFRPDDAPVFHPAELLGAWLMNPATQAKSVLVDDLSTARYWDASAPGAGIWQSAIGVVLETNEDVQGVVVFLGHETDRFGEQELRLVQAAAVQVSAAINNADLYNLIRDQAERMVTLLRAEQEEAEKNSAILEGITDGVLLADASGVIILFNGAAERILELPRDAALGQQLAQLRGTSESAAMWVNVLDEWIGQSNRTSADELILDRLDLGRRVLSLRASPVYVGDQLLGTVAVFRDVTKEVEVDRMKSDFIANVSHELRTPITSIKGFADLFLMGGAGQVNEQQERFMGIIKNNADRLRYLVDDLLSISRLDSGKEKLELTPVNLSEVIAEVVKNVENQFESKEKRLDVSVTVDPEIPAVTADRARLHDILGNLVENAFNYTYTGGKIDITAELQPEKHHVLIAVKDTGIGIPEEFRSRIWNRFERYEEHALVMEVAGTGLGLPIVKTLVEMHNGEVWLESEVNKGTSFYVMLPLDGPNGVPVNGVPVQNGQVKTEVRE
jgi:GAF domain-containing protein/two-component sensor histidine kinase